ncbi:MAG: hypothetical protein NC390_01790 [Fusobacterium sp.]|nr:hypothetical protein [Fusobacterium sp.]
MKKTKSAAFTMAEILLSLTIIGVVAAITLPSLTGNINERTWNTQRKALYARFSQALALMPNLNGYGTLREAGVDGSGSSIAAEDNAAMTFLTDGLAKVMKTTNICDGDSLGDCGIPDTITAMNGDVLNSFTTNYNTLVAFNTMFNGTWNDGTSNAVDYTYEQLDTKAAAFETQNGESIVVYYNPNCKADLNETGWHYSQPKMCANFVYDLNGNKGPNTVGKDIGFITALYPSDPVIVAPMPLATNAGSGAQTNAGKLCQKQDTESRLPNRDELSAMFYNRTLLGIASGNFWSGSVISSGESGTAWNQNFNTGNRNPNTRSNGNNVRCVRR